MTPNTPTTDLTSLAVEIAARQHRGQFDKQGEPYILHPLRVMAGVTRAWKHIHPTLRQTLEGVGVTVNDLRAIAVMHDVLEDTDDRVAAQIGLLAFPSYVRSALEALTRRHFDPNETYANFIERVKLHPLAIHIKLLDLTDNMNRGRGTMSKEVHEGLLRRYARAKAKLEGHLHERIEAITEDLVPQNCSREQPHDGPCNGWPCAYVRAKMIETPQPTCPICGRERRAPDWRTNCEWCAACKTYYADAGGPISAPPPASPASAPSERGEGTRRNVCICYGMPPGEHSPICPAASVQPPIPVSSAGPDLVGLLRESTYDLERWALSYQALLIAARKVFRAFRFSGETVRSYTGAENDALVELDDLLRTHGANPFFDDDRAGRNLAALAALDRAAAGDAL